MRTECGLRILLGGFLCLAVAGAFAQQPPPTPTPAPGAPPAGPSREPAPTPGGQQRQPSPADQLGRQDQQRSPFEQRPIFISGKVVLDDGTPPPEPVVIEAVCSGQVRPQAYTSSKGHFSFQWGQQHGAVLMDASVSSGVASGRDPFSGSTMGGTQSAGLGAVNLMGCELRAALPGYRSEAVVLTRRSMFDNPDVGTIVLRRLANVPGAAISFTTLAAPKEAKKSYEKALKLTRDKNPKPGEAAKELERAVQEYPQYAAAWALLGEARLKMKDDEGARKAFEQSIASDAKYISPYAQLAVIELRASRWKSAAEVTDQLMHLNPQMGQAHYFNAIANYNLGKMDVAEKSARSAIKTDEDGKNPEAHRLLGSILARRGEFPEAAERFRSFLQLMPNSSSAEQLRKQLTEWEGLGVIVKETAPPATKEKP